ncbi:hypothetical protein PQO01_16190 [Lentisphaera marina]|uniref:hypothetical protein n=1 Tax=Lentisphaera marina TaxID=1111041 RepID=UPI0023653705|nr:hypothetical protein [Lentisphaera marina]MDD7986492.1 hypothetical protein [Lentisphaera marina]
MTWQYIKLNSSNKDLTIKAPDGDIKDLQCNVISSPTDGYKQVVKDPNSLFTTYSFHLPYKKFKNLLGIRSGLESGDKRIKGGIDFYLSENGKNVNKNEDDSQSSHKSLK